MKKGKFSNKKRVGDSYVREWKNLHESALRNVKNDDSHTFMDLAEQVEEYNWLSSFLSKYRVNQ